MIERAAVYDRLNAVFEDIFDDDAIRVTDETTADEVDGWDSLAHISLILAVEREFGVRFAATEVGNLKNVGQMVDLIAARATA